MSPLWMVKESPGKGTGMFSTKKIKAGTHVLHDKSVLHVRRTGHQHDPSRITDALKKMSAVDQAKFLSLHEGNRPFPTKELRIWKANAWKDDGVNEFVYLDISRLNHSCLPNAEITQDFDTGTAELYAIRDIAKHEEMFICYNAQVNGSTRRQRRNTFRAYYGFECSCPACMVTPEAVVLSDARRRIINVLSFLVRNQIPPDMSVLDRLTPENAENPEQLRGVITGPLRNRLSQQQHTACQFMLANMYEQEGIRGEEVGSTWLMAASGLMKQLDDFHPIVVIPSAKNVLLWSMRALQATKCARPKNSFPVRKQEEWLEDAKASPSMHAAQTVLTGYMLNHNTHQPMQRPDTFAVRIGNDFPVGTEKGVHLTLMSQNECIKKRRELWTKANESV